METRIFKKEFGGISRKNGFESAFSGWFKESNECIIVLDLQKSNYGNYYQLIIKIFVQHIFGITYVKSKDLVKKEIGDVETGESQEYRGIFDLDILMNDIERKQKLETLFREYIVPITNKGLTRAGIKELAATDQIHLLPAVRKELEKK